VTGLPPKYNSDLLDQGLDQGYISGNMFMKIRSAAFMLSCSETNKQKPG